MTNKMLEQRINRARFVCWALWFLGAIAVAYGLFYPAHAFFQFLGQSADDVRRSLWFIAGIWLFAGVGITWHVTTRLSNKILNQFDEETKTLHEEEAKIISKRVEVIDGRGSSEQAEYFVTVVFSDGQRKTLSALLTNFDIVTEGDSGLLTYEQYHDDSLLFIDFRSTAEDFDVEKSSSGGRCVGCGELGIIGRCPYCRGWIE